MSKVYCPRCDTKKPAKAFAPSKTRTTGRAAYCRECQAAYHREYYQRKKHRYAEGGKYRQRRKDRTHALREERRRQVFEYLLEHPCVDCGESDPRVLEFDHRDPEEKEFEIGAAIRSLLWSDLLAEIDKCDVRCANCHARKTAEQFDYYTHRMLLELDNNSA